MTISTMTDAELAEHLDEIAAEQAHRRNTGTRGDNEYLAAMNADGLTMHASDIRRELNIRNNEKRRTRAYINR